MAALAAFLYGIDRLSGQAGAGLRLLYVSPLKALNYDIERNLRGPLAGLESDLRVAVRTGDTPQRERAAMLREPTLILDEVPAVAWTKRGARRALSVDRLNRLVAAPVQRLAPSATQRPLEEIG